MNYEEKIKKHLENMNYDQNAQALFYLGAICRAVIGDEKKRKGRSLLERKVYIKSEFERDIKALFSEAMLKLAKRNLENKLSWAVKGFIDNYTNAVDSMNWHEKQFYILSGAAFHGTGGITA